ncbi:MAG: asparaginase [Usitatibacter sp.]
MKKPKVALVATGGTIASLGADSLDVLNYGATNRRLGASDLIERFPELSLEHVIIAAEFRRVASNDIGFAEWKELALLLERLPQENPDLAGIVVAHGTATLEETAYFLHLTLRVGVPVVLVGSQRPPTALSSDAGMNLLAAVRTAATREVRGAGVLVVMNDEIHGAREVTKTSTLRLHTFASPDFGMLGQVDNDRVVMLRTPTTRHPIDAPFDLASIEALPRVDICHAYAGCDGVGSRAFVAAGARGIVSAGFAPGVTSPAETAALVEAVRDGIAVVQASRVLSGRVPRTLRNDERGFVCAGNLNPQKSRILLALALTVTRDRAQLQRWFDRY